ncbi:MAG: 1-deoxy-D-xylulose-5-phosphate synthase [Planctomycetota bacterium]
MDRLLDQVTWPEDLKRIPREKLPQLAQEIREYILEVVNTTGGHLGSGMGAVELTLALHYMFNFSEDRLVFDVGHQAYPHKILTGRKEKLWTLRQKDGLSGFTNRFESPYDVYTMGHAGTAISSSLGIAYGDSLRGRKRRVVAVVGDAAFGCGVAFEAMNHGGSLGTRLLVILNDNHWSIAKTVGALSGYLNKVRTGSFYHRAKKTIQQLIQSVPVIGEKLEQSIEDGIKILQNTMVPGQLFEALGSHYYGPINGHDVEALLSTFEHVKDLEGVVLVHAKTEKGKGVPEVENKFDRAHAAKPRAGVKLPAKSEPGAAKRGGPKTAGTEPTVVIPANPPATVRKPWTKWFGDALVEAADRDERVVALTAAMPDGTGILPFIEKYPRRCLDGGIAEQHTVAFASGLATAGLRPVVAIYSTFLQRGYDQVFQEVLLQKLPIVFAMDRAGVVGEDGMTHMGLFDVAYLGSIPGIVLMAPRDGVELGMMLDFGLTLDCASGIRYARGGAPEGEPRGQRQRLEAGKSETLRQGRDLALVAYGSEVEFAMQAAEILANEGIEAEVVNARFAKPVDCEMVRDLRSRFDLVLTVEDHSVRGGFGSCFLEALHALPPVRLPRVRVLGVPDELMEHASRAEQLEMLGLDAKGIAHASIAELDLLRSSGRFVVGLSEERRP